MDDMAVVIMEKDPKTGLLSRELGSYHINYDLNLIDKIFVTFENGEKIVNEYLTTPGEFKDWEFNAIYDTYDMEIYGDTILSMEEDDESYNPTWLVRFDFLEDDVAMESKLNEILRMHSEELKNVLEKIKGMEEEYRV
jgi:hypothetical protein